MKITDLNKVTRLVAQRNQVQTKLERAYKTSVFELLIGGIRGDALKSHPSPDCMATALLTDEEIQTIRGVAVNALHRIRSNIDRELREHDVEITPATEDAA